MAGLAVLSVGLAAFLGCLTQSHRLLRDAERLSRQQAAATAMLEFMAPGVSTPLPGPAALGQSGARLCRLKAGVKLGRTTRQVSTVRFCLPETDR
jgi:hypothetical protein